MTEQRFQVGFEEEPSDEPGLVLTQDGDVELVAPGGARSALASNGGSQPPVPSDNWAQIDLNASPVLTVGSPRYVFQEADLSIRSQAGTDFSVGSTGVGGSGAFMSEAGGWFQAACFASAPGGIALDEGSGEPRWMEFAYSVGHDETPFRGQALGVDVFLPVVASNGNLADTRVCVPGYVAPGGAVLFAISVELLNGFGTDAITDPLLNFGRFVLWQVA